MAFFATESLTQNNSNSNNEKILLLDSQEKAIYVTTCVIQMLLGFIFNGCVLYLFNRNSYLLDIPANLILRYMSITDFFTCVFLLPFEMCLALHKQHDRLDHIQYYVIFFTLNITMNGAVLMSVDRLLAVVYPLRYHVIMTISRVRRSFAFSCILSFLLCILLFVGNQTKNGSMEYIIVSKDMTCCILIIISYVTISYIANKQVRRIMAKSTQIKGEYYTLVCKRTLKSAKKSGIVVFFFLLSIAPFSLLHIYHSSSSNRYNNEHLFWSFLLLFWQSSLNPLLFCIFSEKLRIIARKTFCCAH